MDAKQFTMAELMDKALAKRELKIKVRSFVTVQTPKVWKDKKGVEHTKMVPVKEERIRETSRPWTNARIARVIQYISNRRGLMTHYTEGYINAHERFRMKHKARPSHATLVQDQAS